MGKDVRYVRDSTEFALGHVHVRVRMNIYLCLVTS